MTDRRPVLVVSGTRRALTHPERLHVLRSIGDMCGGYNPEVRVGDCNVDPRDPSPSQRAEHARLALLGRLGVDALVAYTFLDGTPTHRADWQTHGNAAGPRRNAAMMAGLDERDLLLAFPDARSHSGTLDAIKCAIRRGMQVRVYSLGGE